MNFANSLKKLSAEFNAALRICNHNVGLKSNGSRASLDALKLKDVSLHIQPLPLSVYKDTEKLCFTFPEANVSIKKNIIEPNNSIKINFNLPIRSTTNTFLDLPLYIEKEIKDPTAEKVIDKKATHLTIIRRRKMKKHKYKKYLKKHKVEIANRSIQRKLKKESDFQLSLNKIFSEAETYSAEEYMNKTLEKVNWERPITRVKGFLAPKWVVNQYLEEREERRKVKERIDECLNFK